MKTFVRIVIVLVVLNLVMGNFALAQSASEKEEMEAAQEDMKKAGEKMREAGQKMREAGERYRNELFTGLSRSRSTLQHSGAGRVLVIPTAEMKVQDLVAIMEDMNIMSRIFDKKLKEANLIPRFGGYSDGVFFSWNRPETKGFYLEGYGALFLLKVNYPLSPPVETEEEQIKEDVDLIWEQTRQEIYEPEDVKRAERHKRTSKRSREEYDADKVEDLKRTLTRVLKHAANIQNLKPNEWVILTVVGETEQTGEVIVSRIYTVIKGDDITADLPLPLPIEAGFSSPTVLVIRVKKSDVDAFSKGEQDFGQFRKRVQIFTY